MHAPQSATFVRQLRRERIAGSLAAVGGILLIALLTRRPAAETPVLGAPSEIWCIRCGTYGTVDALLNTLLFIPLGVGLGLMRLRFTRAVLATFALTVAVESLQLALVAGRDASISDLFTNTLGGVLGFVIAGQWRAILWPGPARATRIGVAGALLWIVSRIVTAWMLVPSLPESTWYAQLAPKGVYPADFDDSLWDARIAGQRSQVGILPLATRAALVSTPSAAASFARPRPTQGLASIVSVLDDRHDEILLLGQEGRDARFRLRLRAADARLRVPSVRLSDAFLEGRAGESRVKRPTVVVLRGEATAGRLRVQVLTGTREAAQDLDLAAGMTWGLLLPFDVGLGPEAPVVTALWTGCVLFVVFAFSVRGGQSTGVRLTWSLGVIAVGLLLPPFFYSVAPADGFEWLGAFGGAALAGVAFGRRPAI